MIRPVTDADLWTPDACPACDSTAPRSAIAVANESPRVDWLECSACRGASYSRMPSDEYLDAFYAGYYSDQRRSSDVDNALWPKIAHRISKQISLRTAGADAFRILDFGGGRGGVSLTIAKQLARTRPVTVTIVDRSFEENHASRTEDGIPVDCVRTLAQADGTFDLVIASAVLEHVPRLAPVLRDLLHKIRDSGGGFYARTPYGLPLHKLSSRYNMHFPQHVHDLGPSFWNRLIERHGIAASSVVSQPSIVESLIWDRPAETVAAIMLKLPGHIERWVRRNPTDYLWNWVGGWELFLTRA
jgi:SAM-dependent methyltransferase